MAAIGLTIADANPSGKTLFAVSFYSTDARDAEIIKAAPTSGAIYLTSLMVSVGANVDVDVGSGIDSNAVEDLAFKFYGSAVGTIYTLKFEHPIKMVDVKALAIDSSVSGDITGFVEGFVS